MYLFPIIRIGGSAYECVKKSPNHRPLSNKLNYYYVTINIRKMLTSAPDTLVKKLNMIKLS